MTVGEQTGCMATPVVADFAPQIRLVIQNGSQKGTRLACRHVITILGSRTGCKVRLPHERVAPAHAVIFNDGHKVTAVDLLSRTGSLLNGLKMEQEKLSEGDRIEIGPWDFVVEISKPPRNGSPEPQLEPAPNAIALEHVDTGRVLQPNREVCLIGRKSGCDIVVDSPDVSRVHALLVTYREHPAIVDLLSTNGTLVNDKRVAFQVLKDGDIIDVGESKFRIRVIGSGVAEKAGKRPAKAAASKSGSPQLADPLDASKSASAKASVNGNGLTPGAVKSGAANGSASEPLASEIDEVLELEPADGPLEIEAEPDLISIESVESAQRWRVADDLEKLEKAGR